MSAFEQELWSRLVAECDADQVILGSPRANSTRLRRRTVVPAAAAAIATASAATLVLTLTTSAQPAYALTRHSNGSVTVTIHDVAKAVPQLNARFRRMGIDETVIPVKEGCSRPGVIDYPGVTMSTSLTFYPHHAHLAPGYDGVLAAEQLQRGKVALLVGSMRPPLPSCLSNVPLKIRR